MSRVLLGDNPGRETNDERILCYNIGLGLHDAFFASHLYDILQERDDLPSFTQDKETSKFWI